MTKSPVKTILILIIVFFSLLRLIGLKTVPPSLFSDEVDLGYQAYSFLHTGKDYYGNRFPVSFHSFADFRAPFYIYSAAGTISLFGLNELGVRLPASIYGILGIIAVFFLVKEISHNLLFSLLTAVLLSILPWHFHYSRAGFEATAVFFEIAFGLFLFFKSLRTKSFKTLFLSLLVLMLGFYTYATARLFLPLLGIAAAVIFKKEIFVFGWKKITIVLFVVGFLLLPFLKDSLTGGAMHRFSYLNIFSDSNLKFEVDRDRLVDATHNKKPTVGMKTVFMGYLFHNKPVYWLRTIINNYYTSFSGSFLFLKGDPNLRHGVGNFGVIYVVLAPFLLLGIIQVFFMIKEKKKDLLTAKQSVFWFIFLILSPLSSSITYDGGYHATRLFLMVLPLVLLISVGVWKFIDYFTNKKLKNLILFTLTISLFINGAYYFHQYFYHYPVESEKYWHNGFKEGIKLVQDNEQAFEKVIFNNTYEQPLMFFLFWTKYSPVVFQAGKIENSDESWLLGQKIGKYYFGRIGTGFLDSYLPSQIKSKNFENILIFAGRNDFGGDLEKEVPDYLKVVEKISLLSNQPDLFLLRTKTLLEIQDLKTE